METSLINLLCSTPSGRIQSGATLPQGKDADMGSFYSLLQDSLNEGGEAPSLLTATEGASDAKSLSSTDALSRSLDIIDALAFLPVLLTTQSQMENNPQAGTGTPSYSTNTIEDLLAAIASALETGNVEDLKKTLGENKGLQDLLSGQGSVPPPCTLSTETAGSVVPVAAEDSTSWNSRQGENSVSNAVASLIAALDTGNGQAPAKLSSGISGDTSQKSAGGQSENSVSDAVASLIAALDAVYARTSEGSSPAVQEKTTPDGVSKSKNQETRTLPDGQGKEDTGSASSTAGNDNVVRNTMLLGAMLPNLLTVKPDSGTIDSGSGKTVSDNVSQEFLSSIVLAGTNNVQGSGQGSAQTGTNRPASREADQSSGTKGLSEDYVLLNTRNGSSAEDAVPVSGKVFEVLYTKAGDAADGSVEDKGAGQSSARQIGNILNQEDNTVQKDSAADARKTVKNDVAQFPGDVTEKQGEAAKTGSLANEKTFNEKVELVDSMKKENSFTDLAKDNEEKPARENVKTEGSDGKENVNILAHNSAKATASSQKSTATGQATASQASAMIHKIEELAENYSAKNQSMDMVLRLNVDEKESLVVGLRSQGDRVLVEVKGASDGLMSALQSQKDVITKELESKHIYTTINVEIKGDDSNSNGKDQRQRQERNGNEKEKGDFRGILNALA